MRNTFRGERVLNVRIPENAFDVLTEIALREHRHVTLVASDGLTKYARYVSSGKVEKMAYAAPAEEATLETFLDPMRNPFLESTRNIRLSLEDGRALLDALSYGGPGNEDLVARLEKIFGKVEQHE
jgi:hypothetical protein